MGELLRGAHARALYEYGVHISDEHCAACLHASASARMCYGGFAQTDGWEESARSDAGADARAYIQKASKLATVPRVWGALCAADAAMGVKHAAAALLLASSTAKYQSWHLPLASVLCLGACLRLLWLMLPPWPVRGRGTRMRSWRR